jgi:hypothetical protein
LFEYKVESLTGKWGWIMTQDRFQIPSSLAAGTLKIRTIDRVVCVQVDLLVQITVHSWL